MSQDDIKSIIKLYKERAGLFIFIFALFTGMRQGEILALTHGDIDFASMQINVSKSLYRVTVDGKNQLLITPTKTNASIRKITIMNDLVYNRKEHIKKEQIKRFSLKGRFIDVSDYLFTQRNGSLLEVIV